MNQKTNKKQRSDKSTGKFLSLILRHQPETIGIELDENGWVEIEELLAAVDRHGKPLSRRKLDDLVENNDKKRYAASDDGLRIRANQGHSIEVDLAYEPAEPPEFLTMVRRIDSSFPSRRRGSKSGLDTTFICPNNWRQLQQ